MKNFFKWIIEHPLWTFLGAVLGIIGIFATVLGWFQPTEDPEIEALEVLLKDTASEAIQVARFADYSDEHIENMLGERAGWSSSAIRAIEYTQRATENVTNSQGYPKLTEHGRKLFNSSNVRLEKYKDSRVLFMRRHALRHHACGLVVNAIREIAVANEMDDIERCLPITEQCENEILDYGNKIGIGLSGCVKRGPSN